MICLFQKLTHMCLGWRFLLLIQHGTVNKKYSQFLLLGELTVIFHFNRRLRRVAKKHLSDESQNLYRQQSQKMNVLHLDGPRYWKDKWLLWSRGNHALILPLAETLCTSVKYWKESGSGRQASRPQHPLPLPLPVVLEASPNRITENRMIVGYGFDMPSKMD